jgi:microcystin-dependent protein
MTLRSKKIVSFSPRGIIGHLTERKEVLPSNPFRQYLDQFRFRIENMAEPAGTVKMSFVATEPEGWFFLNGQTVDERLYPDLAEIFGAVGGIITLPDYAGRIAMGAGSIVALNGTAGAETVTLTREEMPRHNHGVTDPGHTHGALDRGHTHGLQLDSHTHTVEEGPDNKHTHDVTDAGHSHGITDPGHNHVGSVGETANTAQSGADADSPLDSTVTANMTGISIDSATTGLTVGESTDPMEFIVSSDEVTGSVLKSRADIRVHKSKTGIETVEDGDGKPFSIIPPVFGVNWLVKA